MAKSGGFGPGAKKMGGPGVKPKPPSMPMMGAGASGGSAMGPGGPSGAFKKGGVVKKMDAKKDDKKDDKKRK